MRAVSEAENVLAFLSFKLKEALELHHFHEFSKLSGLHLSEAESEPAFARAFGRFRFYERCDRFCILVALCKK